jgi:protein-tyrosine phosphatase
MFNIIIICTGNTCRSPMAEGILKSLLEERGVADIRVTSAGIGAMDGLPATPFAIEAARAWNVDISGHLSRQLTKRLIAEADLILAMSREHVEFVARQDRNAMKKTFLIKGFPASYLPSQESVRDPIGGTLDEYNQTFMELDEVLRRSEGIILKWVESSKSSRLDSHEKEN